MSDEPQSEQSTALAESRANPLALVGGTFSDEEVGAIAKFIGVAADDPAFRPFLAVAASLDLSPLNGEIWLIKGRREEHGNWVDFYRPAVGRDGFLAKAEEKPTFAGIRSNTVCANDTFEIEDDGFEVKVLHRFKSLSPGAEKGKESRYRGPVIGAWAKLFFNDGRPPLFYFAPAHEHVKTKVKDGNREFQGAWSYTSAMCEKAAQSRVLRLGFRLTGAVPVDEIRADDPQMAAQSPSGAAPADAESLGDDPDQANTAFLDGLDQVAEATRRDLAIALEALNDLSPFSWTASKLRMRLGSECDQERAEEVLAEVEGEFKALRDKQAEAEEAEIAVEVIEASELKPGFELRRNDDEWAKVADVILDEGEDRVVIKLADESEWLVPPTEEVDIRRPADADGEG